jgi:hypothetical protein
MPDIALYYPYSHVRDQGWLKAAALYLPRLALLYPPGYPRALSQVAEELRAELGFIVDVDPGPRTHRVAVQFLELINRESAALQARYAWPREFPAELRAAVADDSDARCYQGHVDDDRVEWIHIGKIQSRLADALIETCLGVPSEDRMWIAMHPVLGSVYLAAVADRVARANDMPAVTDRPQAHGALNGWDVATLARVLLDADDDDDVPAARPPAQVAALYAALAIQAVVPAGLADIPVGKIVQARRTLAAEFDAFVIHLEGLAGQFSELARIEDEGILRVRLEVLAGRDLRRPVDELEKGLRRIGLRPARAVLGMKSLALPAVASAAATGAGLPVITGQAGMVATQFITSTIQARQAAEEVRRSAAGYLLGLHRELTPATTIERIRRTFRRASLPGHIPAADGA